MPQQPSRFAYDPFAPGMTGDQETDLPQVVQRQTEAEQNQPRKYGIAARLLGLRHQDNMLRDQREAEFVLNFLRDVAQGRSVAPPETVDLFAKRARKLLGNEFGDLVDTHLAQQQAARAVEARRQQLPGQAGTQPPPGLGQQPPQQMGTATPPVQPPQEQPQGQPQGPRSFFGVPTFKPTQVPQPPFGAGAGSPAGAPAPAAPPNPVKEMVNGEMKGREGFGGPPPPMTPPPSRGSMFANSPMQIGVDEAARQRPTLQAQSDIELGAAPLKEAIKARGAVTQKQLEYEMRKRLYAGEKWFQDLEPRAQAAALTETNIPAEVRFNEPGVTRALPGDVDEQGNPVTPGTIGRRSYRGGKWFFREEMGGTHRTVMPDSDSPTGFSEVELTRDGEEIGRVKGVLPNPAFAPSVSSSSGMHPQLVQVGDHYETVWMPSTSTSTTQRVVLGQTPTPGPGTFPTPPGAAPGPTPAPRVNAPGPNAPKVTAVIGPDGKPLQTANAWNKEIENPYDEKGREGMAQISARKDMIDRLIAYLKPYSKTDIPLGTFFNRLLYDFGFDGDQGGFLSQLELGSMAQAAQLVQGASKAHQVLSKALIHTPNAWKDSSKMMYNKLVEIRRNMDDMERAINKYHLKNPGLHKPVGSGMEPPPGGGDETDEQRLARLKAKYGQSK